MSLDFFRLLNKNATWAAERFHAVTDYRACDPKLTAYFAPLGWYQDPVQTEQSKTWEETTLIFGLVQNYRLPRSHYYRFQASWTDIHSYYIHHRNCIPPYLDCPAGTWFHRIDNRVKCWLEYLHNEYQLLSSFWLYCTCAQWEATPRHQFTRPLRCPFRHQIQGHDYLQWGIFNVINKNDIEGKNNAT
jgi:hypothetical protein